VTLRRRNLPNKRWKYRALLRRFRKRMMVRFLK